MVEPILVVRGGTVFDATGSAPIHDGAVVVRSGDPLTDATALGDPARVTAVVKDGTVHKDTGSFAPARAGA